MGTFLGGLLGLGGSLAPTVIEYFNKKQELSHERDIKRMELDAVKLGHEFNFKIETIKAETTETQSLLQHDSTITINANGGKLQILMELLRASVRPVITYAFFGLFLVVKLSGLYIAWYVQQVPLAPALLALWDPDTAALFAAIMGFWFGQRAISRFGFGSHRNAPSPASSTSGTAMPPIVGTASSKTLPAGTKTKSVPRV